SGSRYDDRDADGAGDRDGDSALAQRMVANLGAIGGIFAQRAAGRIFSGGAVGRDAAAGAVPGATATAVFRSLAARVAGAMRSFAAPVGAGRLEHRPDRLGHRLLGADLQSRFL